MSIFCIGIYIIFVNYKKKIKKKEKKLFQQCSIKQVPDTFQVSKPMITSTSYGKIEATDPGGATFRAGLHHIGEVHLAVKKFSPIHGYWRQGRYAGEDEKTIKICY